MSEQKQPSDQGTPNFPLGHTKPCEPTHTIWRQFAQELGKLAGQDLARQNKLQDPSRRD